jgi:DNA-binding NarL/FixJ family response regulator
MGCIDIERRTSNLMAFKGEGREAVMSVEERYGNRVLSQQESVIIELVAQGLKNGEVAQAMGTTTHVVKNCLRTIYDKLGLWNRVELALWHEARQHGAN